MTLSWHHQILISANLVTYTFTVAPAPVIGLIGLLVVRQIQIVEYIYALVLSGEL